MLMEEYKQRGQPAYLRLMAARTKLEKFRPGARLCDIDKKFCVDYAEWLQSEPLTPQGKPLAQATAFSSFWNLGITLSSARQKGYKKSNPWELLGSHEKIQQPEGKREFLTFEEIRKAWSKLPISRKTYARHFCLPAIADCVSAMLRICAGGTYPSMVVDTSYRW
ncbi:MAG: phage integrase SAM-like domain-containing protein [Bacteroidales bacterium]|nr:MAG: phage integrase SAM-like domain-containing protein [Bacteroidales bacterium]